MVKSRLGRFRWVCADEEVAEDVDPEEAEEVVEPAKDGRTAIAVTPTFFLHPCCLASPMKIRRIPEMTEETKTQIPYSSDLAELETFHENQPQTNFYMIERLSRRVKNVCGTENDDDDVTHNNGSSDGEKDNDGALVVLLRPLSVVDASIPCVIQKEP